MLKFLLFCTTIIWVISLWIGSSVIQIFLYGEKMEASISWSEPQSCEHIKDRKLKIVGINQELSFRPSLALCQEKPVKLLVWVKGVKEQAPELITVDRLEESLIKSFNLLILSSFLMVFFVSLYVLTHTKEKKHHSHKIEKKIGFFDLDAQEEEEERRERREDFED